MNQAIVIAGLTHKRAASKGFPWLPESSANQSILLNRVQTTGSFGGQPLSSFMGPSAAGQLLKLQCLVRLSRLEIGRCGMLDIQLDVLNYLEASERSLFLTAMGNLDRDMDLSYFK
jgi:hypothetical protein